MIVGPTKTGKSVLVKTVFSKTPMLWVHGGEIKDENDFWFSLLHQLELATSITEGGVDEISADLNTSIESTAKAFSFLGISQKNETRVGTKSTTNISKTRVFPPKIVVLAYLKKSKIPLVIDDFHFIKSETSVSIVRALKGVVSHGFPMFIITVPSKREAISEQLPKEMIGRIMQVEIPSWSVDELAHIAKTGFEKRGYMISRWQIDAITSRCLGNPLIMQDLCLHLARMYFNRDADRPGSMLPITQRHIHEISRTMAENLGQDIYNKITQLSFAKVSQSFNVDRLKEVHNATLRSIARLNKHVPHTIDHISLLELHEKVILLHPGLCVSKYELRHVAELLSEISSSEYSSVPVVHYRKSKDILQMTDPMFTFFLNTVYVDIEPERSTPTA